MVLAKKKEDRVILIPLSIFLDRGVSVLEAVSEYLKDSKKLSYHEIAVLLNRDDRTIWTCYNRAKKKKSRDKNQNKSEKNKRNYKNNYRYNRNEILRKK